MKLLPLLFIFVHGQISKECFLRVQDREVPKIGVCKFIERFVVCDTEGHMTEDWTCQNQGDSCEVNIAEYSSYKGVCVENKCITDKYMAHHSECGSLFNEEPVEKYLLGNL
jgi:hypothetical protein